MDLDLSFEQTHRFRPFHLIAPGFGVDLPTAGGAGLTPADTGPAAPYAAVEVRREGPGPAAAGLATATGDQVLVRWSPEDGELSLEVSCDGRTHVLGRKELRLPDDASIALVLCENRVTALVGRGDGWRPVLTERKGVSALVDLRRQDVLQAYRYAWSGPGTARAGLFGCAGLRDPHLVQHADGTPYVRDGRTYLTWTAAGLGFFQQAHWTVWSIDPVDPTDLRLEAHLFSRRDGLVLGDHAGQLVRAGEEWLVLVSSWGDFTPGAIHVRQCRTSDDLLSGVHLLQTERAPLPTEHGTWDPALTRVDGSWQVAYVESPSQDPFDFHPALAATSSAEWTQGLKTVFAADDLHHCEGPVLASVAGRMLLLASDGEHRRYPVFDLHGSRLGDLDAPYGTNIPHPQLVPDPRGGWWLITFDGSQYAKKVLGYGGHGDVVVMHSRTHRRSPGRRVRNSLIRWARHTVAASGWRAGPTRERQ